jgi:hypothetical protein
MTIELPSNYLTKKQACKKFDFLTENMLKNLLFKNPNGFRDKVVHRLGRRILISEESLLKYLAESK